MSVEAPASASASTSTSTVPLTSQVGGHAGVLTSEDGSLLIKPALPLELAFYQGLAGTIPSDDDDATTTSAFDALKPYIPRFLGTLKLQGKIPSGKPLEAGVVLEPVKVEDGEKDESFYDEPTQNLSHPFTRPNIMDIKLGTVLYDETANAEKVERMKKTAQDTTSLETGVRLTGFQVYDNTTHLPVNTPKSYGKSISASDLPDGIARFFPVAGNTPGGGLEAKTLLPIITAVRADVASIRDAFAGIEMRMVGGSLLVVYEAEWKRAEEGVAALLEGRDEELDNEEDDSDEEEEEIKPVRAYAVKLIDFAHTRLAPAEGPDEGVLKGMDTVLQLLDGRTKEIQVLL